MSGQPKDWVTASANARVNLIGDHVDYNGGIVLPMLLPLETTVRARLVNNGGNLVASSAGFPTITRKIDGQPASDWSDYVVGPLQQLGAAIGGIEMDFASTIPAGASVSSSAAIEIATLRAVRQLLDLDLDDATLAALAHRAENEFVGVPCGMMDQMVISCAKPGQAFRFDCDSMETELINIPFDLAQFVTINSGVHRQLVDGAYAQRRKTCDAVAARYGVSTLRQLPRAKLAELDGIEAMRATHVLDEIDNTHAAISCLRTNNAAEFGKLMTASHVSLRDNYETSTPEVDALIQTCLDAGALGARITGAGFGGCIVVLTEHRQALLNAVADHHPNASLVA